MIITSAPLRFSLVGGGSDLPSFTKQYQGRVLSSSINKRVYITLNFSFSGDYRISYSKLEHAQSIDEIQHVLVRSCLKKVGWNGPGLEITSIADVPSDGTGLGSSSAFTVALLLGLHRLMGTNISKYELAKEACEVEINMARAPIGRQDQFASAFGGLNEFTFSNDAVVVKKLTGNLFKAEYRMIEKLNNHLLFFHFKAPRNANEILSKQGNLLESDEGSVESTIQMADLALSARNAILNGDLTSLGHYMTQGWSLKCQLNGDMDNPKILEILDFAKGPKVMGAKLMGAGGGGFLAIMAKPENHEYIKRSLESRYPYFPIRLESAGPTYLETTGGPYFGTRLRK